MQQPGELSRDEAVDLIRTTDVTALGRRAYRKKQEESGGSVYYLTGPSTAVQVNEARDDGAVDVLVEYGGEPGEEVVEELEEVMELGPGVVRCVEVRPLERTTAYDDLRVVGVTRLYLDGVGVRVSSEVGSKLAQTALEFGADDVGYAGDYEYDVELLIDEAGFTPVRRAPAP